MNKYIFRSILFLAILLGFSSCSGSGDGSPTETPTNPTLKIKIAADCSGTERAGTKCVDVDVDGIRIATSLAPGQEVTKEVSIGNHTIYAIGACDTVREWPIVTRYVPAAGYTETLSCGSTSNPYFSVTLSGDTCGQIVQTVGLYIDGSFKANLAPGRGWGDYVAVGSHVVSAQSESQSGVTWGPTTINVPTQGYNYTLNCNNTPRATYSIAISSAGGCYANCITTTPITISVRDGTHPDSLKAIGTVMVNGAPLSYIAPVGYIDYRADVVCRNPDGVAHSYRTRMYEDKYVPASGYSTTLYCSELQLEQ